MTGGEADAGGWLAIFAGAILTEDAPPFASFARVGRDAVRSETILASMKCFISTKDQAFANRVYADLQNKEVRCWFAPHDFQGGRKHHEQIDEAIRLHDKLLLILSPHSMESEWVKTEIAKARKLEVRDQRRVLFPIRLAPSKPCATGSASTPTPANIPPARFASISSPTSATGKITTPTKKPSSASSQI